MPFSAQHLKSARLHLLKSDPVMKRIIRAVGPCLIKTTPDRFAMLVNSIISQQISGAAARTILGRLKTAVNEAGEFSADVLKEFSIDQLRDSGVSRQKAGYLLDLARQVAAGNVELKNIGRKKNEEVIAELTQIKGIGRWTAQMFLMFNLKRLDVFPVDDLGIRNAITNEYPIRGELTREKMCKLAQSWSPYETIASWYLWRSLETGKESDG